MLVHRPARFFCHESDKKYRRGAELDMTTCRTQEAGGVPGGPARPADLTRTGSGAQRATSPTEQRRRSVAAAGAVAAAAAAAAARRAQPPDLALLRRVRDGLNRL